MNQRERINNLRDFEKFLRRAGFSRKHAMFLAKSWPEYERKILQKGGSKANAML